MINAILTILLFLEFQTYSTLDGKSSLISEITRINWQNINSTGVVLSQDNNYLVSGCISTSPIGIIQYRESPVVFGGIISGFWSSECEICFDRFRSPQKDFFPLSKENLVFKLYQNYPNPFNKITKINYDVPVTCKVQIIIYDISGRCIKQVVNEEKTPGKYEMIWDKKDKNHKKCPSGIYFISMKAKNFKDIRKIIVAE